MSTDSVTTTPAAAPSSPEATPASAPTPQVGEGTRAHAADLRRRLIVSAPLGILAMLLSMVPAWQFTGWQWVVAAASIPVVTWGAWPFHRAAFAAGRHGSTTMDTLVSLGVISSTLWSWWALLWGGAGMLGMRMHMSLIPRAAHGGHAEIYFEGACMIVVFLLTGRYLEARARYRAGDALRSLLRMGAKEATLVRIDPATGERSEQVVPASSLQVGDLFAVRPGEKVATDGIIVEGSSALDTSLLTGESVPVDAAPGDTVTGATVNTWGSLLVRATRVGSDTTLAQIGRMVAEAQAGKAPVQRLADQISGVFVPIVILVSLLTLVGWLLAGGSVQAAFTAAVAVLVVACPCALGLATPTAILVGSGRASQLGILIKNAEILEQTRSIDTMLLDKTGTVTTGVMSLESVAVPSADGSPEVDEASALSLAASVESLSEHPVARAITSGAADRGLSLEPVTAFANQPGLGVVGLTARGGVLVGRPSWLASLGVDVPASLLDAVREAEASGASAVVAALAPK